MLVHKHTTKGIANCFYQFMTNLPEKGQLQTLRLHLILNCHCVSFNIQCSSFITLYFGSIGMDLVISETCYEGTILQRNFIEMVIFI